MTFDHRRVDHAWCRKTEMREPEPDEYHSAESLITRDSVNNNMAESAPAKRVGDRVRLDEARTESASRVKPKTISFSVRALLDQDVTSPSDSGYGSGSPSPDETLLIKAQTDLMANETYAEETSTRSKNPAKDCLNKARVMYPPDYSNLPAYYQNLLHAMNSQFLARQALFLSSAAGNLQQEPGEKATFPLDVDTPPAATFQWQRLRRERDSNLKKSRDAANESNEKAEAETYPDIEREPLKMKSPSAEDYRRMRDLIDRPAVQRTSFPNPFPDDQHQPAQAPFELEDRMFTPTSPYPAQLTSGLYAAMSRPPIIATDYYVMQMSRIMWEQAVRSTGSTPLCGWNALASGLTPFYAGRFHRLTTTNNVPSKPVIEHPAYVSSFPPFQLLNKEMAVRNRDSPHAVPSVHGWKSLHQNLTTPSKCEFFYTTESYKTAVDLICKIYAFVM